MKVVSWKRVQPSVETKVDYRYLVVKTFEVPGAVVDGDPKKLTIATFHKEGSRSGAVIALTKDKKVIVARQFHHGPEKIMDELPGGGINAGEDPETGVRRELLEETGYRPGKMEFLGTSSRDAYSNCTWYYYMATDCVLDETGAPGDEDEQIEVELMPVAEFLETAKNDGMTDPAAVLMAYDKLKELL